MYKIKCIGNCGNFFFSTSPESSYNWATKTELICSKCEDAISGDAGRDEK
jgi:hypothetical protein